MITAALELGAAGWHVFPCWWAGPRAKSPITKHGHLEATTDPDQIKTWWRRWPYAMIGAPVPDSAIVIDIDPRNGGDPAELESLTAPMPDTLTAWSGRNDGGRHLYFRRPAGALTSTKLPAGIDLKVRGYCILPPSIHPATGHPYSWDEQPVAPAPLALRELLRPTPKPATVHRGNGGNGAGLVRTVAEAPERKRHNALVWAAYRARDDGILTEITDELVAAAVAAGGETETSARRVIASVRKASS
jgi:hypothetical protein